MSHSVWAGPRPSACARALCAAQYNHVLRAKSGNAFIVDMTKKMCKDNTYPTTIHAINSLIIKLSKLTVATKVYRGMCYAKLPDSIWQRNAEGIRCGIE
jgi:energy-converting hydrogenase Eha subunit B